MSENDDPYYSAYTYSLMPHPLNGLNSGVWLVNLENLRNRHWNTKMLTIYEETQSYSGFVDQDILNVYSYLYPEELQVLPCSANFRADLCLSPEACQMNSTGLMLHGSRACFHDKWQFGGMGNYVLKLMDWIILRNVRFVEYGHAIR